MQLPRVAVLVDLTRGPASGGHVKYWERIAQAAVTADLPVELTIYFEGDEADEILSPTVRLRSLPPVFSTTRLKFLPYIPAHTDLAFFHPKLACELADYDLIHTTDAFFAHARTAERISKWHRIPLVTSFHTDTPAYSELFTRATIEKILGPKAGGWVSTVFRIPQQEKAAKIRRLRKHMRRCMALFAMRPEDIDFATQAGVGDKIRPMHLGVDKDLFAPQRRDRDAVERAYSIAPGKFMILFVGRVDEGKNMHVLMQACANAIASGANLHLVVAGLGPMIDEIRQVLGDNVTLLGQATPVKLARLYASVDCLAIASDIEIGGMIGVEALSAGCPVIVSKLSGVSQLCGDTPAMLKVESGVEPWSKALAALAGDPGRLSAMRDAAFVYSRDSLYSWADVLNRDFMPVWRELIQAKGK